MIYVISKETYGQYEVRDIQCNANWDCCPYSEYALIPENLLGDILATQGYCDIVLNDAGNEVVSFTAREIPSVPDECCGDNTVLSVNGVKANSNGELTLTHSDVGAVSRTLVWENPDPSVTFPETVIPDILSADYDAFDVVCQTQYGGDWVSTTHRLDCGSNIHLLTLFLNGAHYYREIELQMRGIMVKAGYWTPDKDTTAQANGVLTPVKIYGIKNGQAVEDDNSGSQGDSSTGTTKPLVLYGNETNTNPEEYLNNAYYGDEALAAILAGRQILVKTPNASGDNYVASYSPVYMYQLPNYQNNYLYLFYLRDEKQDLSALLGQPAGTVMMPVYGQFKMLLSETYNTCPLTGGQ